MILSGGNVDPGLLAAIVQRHEAAAGRRLRLFTRIPDRPGALAALLAAVADAGGNVVQADHVRDAMALHVQETGVEIALETRGVEHSRAIVGALEREGYVVARVDDLQTPRQRVRFPPMRRLAGPTFIFAGIMHFVIPKVYRRIMPPYIPAPMAMVYASGVAEIAGGAGAAGAALAPCSAAGG